jgi:hypothetical protein
MERLATPEEIQRLRRYFREFNKLSRIALYGLIPAWLATGAWLVFDILSQSNSANFLLSGLSASTVNRFEIFIGLTLVCVIALRENRRETWQIGRVRQTMGLLTCTPAEDGKTYMLDGDPLWIPYTMHINVAQFEGKSVLVERADVLRTGRKGDRAIEQLVVSIRDALEK